MHLSNIKNLKLPKLNTIKLFNEKTDCYCISKESEVFKKKLEDL